MERVEPWGARCAWKMWKWLRKKKGDHGKTKSNNGYDMTWINNMKLCVYTYIYIYILYIYIYYTYSSFSWMVDDGGNHVPVEGDAHMISDQVVGTN